MRKALVLNGPNLNLLGRRNPEIYGSTTLAQLNERCRSWGLEVQLEVETFQSNHEGALIDRIHDAITEADALVINPGAFTHYSYALHDAIQATGLPCVEVHISNVEEREPWRRVSVIRAACVYTIYGRGIEGYRWALRHLAFRAVMPFETVAYGSQADQVFDLRRPSSAPRGLVVLIHGGFWRHTWTRDLMDGMAVDLARRGWLTANLEYRRVGKGGGWPASLEDVINGVRRAVEATSPQRVVLVGHSAGGHLALLAAEHLGSISGLSVVALAPVTDLAAAAEEDLGGGAARAFLGDAQPEDASPLHRPPLSVPVLLIHGEGDDRVPFSHSQRYAAAANAELTSIDDPDHFTFLFPERPRWENLVEEITAFAQRGPAR